MKHLYNLYRFLFARRVFQKVNNALFNMSIRGLGILNFENSRVSGEEYLIKRLLPKLIKNNDPVFVDVGANVGKYSLLLRESFPAAAIYAFEPQSSNYSRLCAAVLNKNIKVRQSALGEKKGRLTLYDRADFDGSSHASLYKDVISDIHKQNVIECEVPVETLEDFANDEKIQNIDYLKIDTEGNELAVLKGAGSLIEKNKIKCIHFEFNEMNVVSRVFFRDFRKVLGNYELYRLLPDSLLALSDYPLMTELFAYQNIVAVLKTT